MKERKIKKSENSKKEAVFDDSGYSWYARKIARPISSHLTSLFIRFHPNTITLLMILVGLLSLPFFISGGYWSIILGALILQIHYLLDNIDGDVARATNKKSIRGKYLDFLPNIIVNPLIFITLGYGLFRTRGDITYFLFGISACFFYLAKEPARLFRYLLLNNLQVKSNSKIDQIPAAMLVRLNKYYFEIIDYPGIMNILLIFAIFNLTHYLIIFYGIIFPLYFIARVTYEFRFWKNYDNRENLKKQKS